MSLLFDFTVDKAAKTIHVTREFAADLDLVWDAFTKAEILDKWVAPKPWRAQTKEMDFRVGGRWLYTMVSPDDVSHGWSLVEFLEIQPKTSFSARNSFSDENGKTINNQFSLTKHFFKEGTETTTVTIEKKFDDLSVLEKIVSMGYKEGLEMGMNNLDEYFLSLVATK